MKSTSHDASKSAQTKSMRETAEQNDDVPNEHWLFGL